LLAPLAEPKVACHLLTQTPRENASPDGTLFPDGRISRRATPAAGKNGKARTWIFTARFFSNVSAAIRRDLLMKFPFDEELIMSEDQQVSRDLLNAGYAVVYAPASVVIHSHNYSLRTCFAATSTACTP